MESILGYQTVLNNPFFISRSENQKQKDYYLAQLISYEKHGIDENSFIQQMPDNPQVILDLGANIGTNTIAFCTKYPNTQVIAVELNPHTYEILKQNLSYYPNATALNYGIWKETTDVLTKLEYPEHQGNTIKPIPENWNLKTAKQYTNKFTTVNGITINDLIKKYNLNNTNALLIDIEGAEKYIFPEIFDVCKNLQYIHLETHNISLFCYCYTLLEKHFNCTSLHIDKEFISKESKINQQQIKTYTVWKTKTK